MYGIIKVGAVECEDDEEVCEEFAVYTHPSIIVFQESYNDEGEKYEGKMEWKSIANFATSKMQSFVSIVTSETYPTFIQNQPSKYKVLLFTERKSTAPIFKALSKQFKDKLIFGEVRKSEADLISKFGVTQFPTILVITDPYDYKGDVFQKETKMDLITKFLQQYSYKAASYEKKVEIQHLTYNKYKKENVCAKKSSNVCIILFDD